MQNILEVVNSRLSFLAISIVILSFLDAYFTLCLVDLGGKEANPLMNYFLNKGVEKFIFVKGFLTIIGVCLLLFFSHKFMARFSLLFAGIFYAFVLFYHIFIMIGI